MKLNKKGFMLAEVVIVAAVVSTVLVSLYIGLNRISFAYDKRNKYYDIDAMYAAIEVNNILIKNNEINNYIDDNYKVLLGNQGNQEVQNFSQFYNNTGYNLTKVYYIKSDKVSLEQISDSINNNSYLKDYIGYLEDKIQLDRYNYLILVEIQKSDTDDVYFYTLKVGDEYES